MSLGWSKFSTGDLHHSGLDKKFLVEGKSMKLLKYVMTADAGLAPNPYWGSCTLALCTPNHMNARLDVGDWIVGHTSKDRGRKLVHAMRVTAHPEMSSYFEKYPEKRPNPNGTLEQQCGDNMYYRKGNKWFRLPSQFHNSVGNFYQDIDKPVFIAKGPENFVYFGDKAEPIPKSLPFLIKERQGIAYVRDLAQIKRFEEWFAQQQKGKVGEPRDTLRWRDDRYLLSVDEHWTDAAKLGDSACPPGGTPNPVTVDSLNLVKPATEAVRPDEDRVQDSKENLTQSGQHGNWGKRKGCEK